MPGDQVEPDPVLLNIQRLLTPRWHIFVFVINPSLAWVALMYVILHLHDKSILPTRARVILVVAYLIITWGLLLTTADEYKSRLLEAGYVRKRTPRREFDLLLTVAVGVAGYYWIQSWGDDAAPQPSNFMLFTIMVMSGVLTWGGLTILTLGPTLWFSMKPAHVRDT